MDDPHKYAEEIFALKDENSKLREYATKLHSKCYEYYNEAIYWNKQVETIRKVLEEKEREVKLLQHLLKSNEYNGHNGDVEAKDIVTIERDVEMEPTAVGDVEAKDIVTIERDVEMEPKAVGDVEAKDIVTIERDVEMEPTAVGDVEAKDIVTTDNNGDELRDDGSIELDGSFDSEDVTSEVTSNDKSTVLYTSTSYVEGELLSSCEAAATSAVELNCNEVSGASCNILYESEVCLNELNESKNGLMDVMVVECTSTEDNTTAAHEESSMSGASNDVYINCMEDTTGVGGNKCLNNIEEEMTRDLMYSSNTSAADVIHLNDGAHMNDDVNEMEVSILNEKTSEAAVDNMNGGEESSLNDCNTFNKKCTDVLNEIDTSDKCKNYGVCDVANNHEEHTSTAANATSNEINKSVVNAIQRKKPPIPLRPPPAAKPPRGPYNGASTPFKSRKREYPPVVFGGPSPSSSIDWLTIQLTELLLYGINQRVLANKPLSTNNKSIQEILRWKEKLKITSNYTFSKEFNETIQSYIETMGKSVFENCNDKLSEQLMDATILRSWFYRQTKILTPKKTLIMGKIKLDNQRHSMMGASLQQNINIVMAAVRRFFVCTKDNFFSTFKKRVIDCSLDETSIEKLLTIVPDASDYSSAFDKKSEEWKDGLNRLNEMIKSTPNEPLLTDEIFALFCSECKNFRKRLEFLNFEKTFSSSLEVLKENVCIKLKTLELLKEYRSHISQLFKDILNLGNWLNGNADDASQMTFKWVTVLPKLQRYNGFDEDGQPAKDKNLLCYIAANRGEFLDGDVLDMLRRCCEISMGEICLDVKDFVDQWFELRSFDEERRRSELCFFKGEVMDEEDRFLDAFKAFEISSEAPLNTLVESFFSMLEEYCLFVLWMGDIDKFLPLFPPNASEGANTPPNDLFVTLYGFATQYKASLDVFEKQKQKDEKLNKLTTNNDRRGEDMLKGEAINSTIEMNILESKVPPIEKRRSSKRGHASVPSPPSIISTSTNTSECLASLFNVDETPYSKRQSIGLRRISQKLMESTSTATPSSSYLPDCTNKCENNKYDLNCNAMNDVNDGMIETHKIKWPHPMLNEEMMDINSERQSRRSSPFCSPVSKESPRKPFGLSEAEARYLGKHTKGDNSLNINEGIHLMRKQQLLMHEDKLFEEWLTSDSSDVINSDATNLLPFVEQMNSKVSFTSTSPIVLRREGR